MSDQSEKVLASAGTKKSMMMFKLCNFKGKKLFDIRKYYYSNDNEAYEPTRKGLSLSADVFSVVANVLHSHQQEIEEWLDSDGCTEETAAKSRARSFEQALEAARHGAKPYERAESSWRSPVFFEHTPLGGTSRLEFNAQHPFCVRLGKLRKLAEDREGSADPMSPAHAAITLLEHILVTYSRAKEMMHSEHDDRSKAMFDTLEFNWGCLLERAIEDLAEEGCA